jgi:DNA replication protein DnaC
VNPQYLEILARRGVDPALAVEPPPFDPVAHRLENANAVLAATIPGRFADATVTDRTVAEWVNRFLADPATTPSLFLSGATGVGKSWLMWAALRDIMLERARRGEGLAFRATSHPDLNDRLRPKSDGSHGQALDPFLSAELVLLDDLGAGKQSAWTGDSLYRLVDHRWANCLPMIFTTNLPLAALTEAVGDRVVSRLGDAVRVAVRGDDRRWKP